MPLGAHAWVAPHLGKYSARDYAQGFGSALRAIINRYTEGRALARMDSRMLADIGLTRSDIDSAFADPLWRDPTVRLSVIATERRVCRRRRLRELARTATPG